MIKFFRKIRQNLLFEGKTVNYLKYAIGEIILVVIGILIALQINNWNETQQRKKTEKGYLLSLRSDLTDDIYLLDTIMQIYDHKIKMLDSLLHELQNWSPDADSRRAYQYWYKGIGFPDYRSKEQTIETLKSSGKIETISDEKLRRMIQSYYAHTKEHYIGEESLNSLIVNVLLSHYIFDLGTLQSDSRQAIPYLTNSETEIKALYNDFYLYYEQIKGTKRKLEKLKEEAQEVVKSTDSFNANNE